MAQRFGRIGAGVTQGPRVFTKFAPAQLSKLDQLRELHLKWAEAFGPFNTMAREARRQWEAEYERTYGRKPYEED